MLALKAKTIQSTANRKPSQLTKNPKRLLKFGELPFGALIRSWSFPRGQRILECSRLLLSGLSFFEADGQQFPGKQSVCGDGEEDQRAEYGFTPKFADYFPAHQACV